MTIERLREAAARALATLQDAAGPGASARGRESVVPPIALVLEAGIELAPAFRTETRVELGSLDTTLTLGTIEGVPVASVEAGVSLSRIADRVRVLGLLGADPMVVVGQGSPLSSELSGDLFVVVDHLNLLGDNPLRGPNLDELGPRFPDMTEAYDRRLSARARDAAVEAGLSTAGGVFAALPEPNRLTPQEHAKLRRLGADWVGGGIVPATIVARHMGRRVVGLVEAEGRGGQAVSVLRGLLPRLQG